MTIRKINQKLLSMKTENSIKALEEFILKWARKHRYLDRNNTLKGRQLYDVGYDLKSDIERSQFNDAPRDCFDYWYDLFLDDCIVPILLAHGAETE